VRPDVDPVPGQRAEQVLGQAAATVDGPRRAALRCRARRADDQQSGRRAARPRAAGRGRRLEPEVGRPPAGSPASCAARAGQRRAAAAGRSRRRRLGVHVAGVGAHRDDPAVRAATRSVASVPVSTVTCGCQPVAERRRPARPCRR
jgi:hypothetical protein